MKTLLSISLSALTLAMAVPANANPTTLAPVSIPGVVARGAAQSLNTQPIPPGHAMLMAPILSSVVRQLDMHALNPQPIPPGHQLLLAKGAVKHPHHKVTKHWDVSKNTKS